MTFSDKKPGIAEMVKKLKTRARTAKKLEAKLNKKSITPTKKTKKVITPKKKSPKMSPLLTSIKKPKVSELTKLKPKPKPGLTGQSTGQYSVEDNENRSDFLRFLVETLESDINSAIVSEKPENIEYIIHLISKCKTKSFVELVLSKKPLLERLDRNIGTTLASAIIQKNIEVSKLLNESEADVKPEINVKSETDSNHSLLLSEAINNSQTFELIPLLVSKGSLVNDSDPKTGNTALHLIASRANQKGALSAIEALIKGGADVNAVNLKGWSHLTLKFESFN